MIVSFHMVVSLCGYGAICVGMGLFFCLQLPISKNLTGRIFGKLLLDKILIWQFCFSNRAKF